MIYRIIYFILVAATLAACGNLEQTITPDLRQTTPKVVINGLITDDATQPQTIELSRSTGFYTTGETEKISNATVTVQDDLGNLFEFEEDDNNAGLYIANFIGEIGRTYSMDVTVDGQLYEATETLLRVTTFDSLTWVIDEEERQELEDEEDTSGEYYDVLMFVKEPPETEDYYRFKFYTDGEEDTNDFSEVYYSDDVLLSEAIDGLESVRYYAFEDSVTIEAYSISRQAFLFYSDLQILLDNDGGLFGPIPADLRNNISNGALGYFQVSAKSSASIIVGE